MRIKDKIKEIETFLEELKDIVPDSFEEYLENKEKKAACERYAEKIIEATIDLVFIFIKEAKLKKPEDDHEAFEILKNNEIITEELSEKLKDAKSMRNFLAHQYGKIDDEIIFSAVSEELKEDIKEFIKEIRNQFKKQKKKE